MISEVILGAIAGHSICTGLAVFGGEWLGSVEAAIEWDVLWDVHGIFMGFSWDCHGTFVGFSWDLGDVYGIFMGFKDLFWDFNGILMGSQWDLMRFNVMKWQSNMAS